MTKKYRPSELLDEMLNAENFLIIQDVDGVCIPLVKDPLTRKLDLSYIESASLLKEEFAVLTNGEHAGYRGLNRVIRNSYINESKSPSEGKYLPGLAAGGIEYQNRFGEVSYPGVTRKELDFLSKIPVEMQKLLKESLQKILVDLKEDQIESLSRTAVLETRFSPTINLNKVFSKIPNDLGLQREVQSSINNIMNRILEFSKESGLENSFFLHIAPNLGKTNGKEELKYACEGDVGTTDIQFMLSGSLKESGLLVLLNKYLEAKNGKSPFGDNFNVRNAPKSIIELKDLCLEKIQDSQMPMLIGIGDTVTSNHSEDGKEWLRGGSDRGFLTLIQELGKQYSKDNKVVLVDSSGGEVDRPSLSTKDLKGISDPYDPLKFNTLFSDGPSSYINWFNKLAEARIKKQR